MKTRVFKGIGYSVAALALAASSLAFVSGTTYATSEVTGNTTLSAGMTDVVVPSGSNVTINLNGNDITGVESHAIKVESGATLTVNGAGKITSSGASKASIYNEGTVILNGGTVQKDDKNWYDIYNTGTLTIDGATILNTADYSDVAGASLIDNYGTVNVKSGSLTGGLNAIKNEPTGTATITGGKLTNASNAVVLNYNMLSIGGSAELEYTGSYELGAIISVGQAERGSSIYDKTEISGGVFKGENAFVRTATNSTNAYIKISGGDFRGVEKLRSTKNSSTLQIMNRMKGRVSGGVYNEKIWKAALVDGYTTYDSAPDEYTVDLLETVNLPEKILLKVGESYTFEAGKYTTTGSADQNIATNDGLTITGVKAGETFVNFNSRDVITPLETNIDVVVYEENDDTAAVHTEVVPEAKTEDTFRAKFGEDVLSALQEKVGNDKIAGYFDINVKIVDQQGDELGQVAETSSLVKIEVNTPDGLPAVADGYKRVWYFVYQHNGEVKRIEATESNGKITAYSKEFSPYILAYVDVAETETVTSTAATTASLNPNTLDNVSSYFVAAGVAATVMLGAIVYLMRQEA